MSYLSKRKMNIAGINGDSKSIRTIAPMMARNVIPHYNIYMHEVQ